MKGYYILVDDTNDLGYEDPNHEKERVVVVSTDRPHITELQMRQMLATRKEPLYLTPMKTFMKMETVKTGPYGLEEKKSFPWVRFRYGVDGGVTERRKYDGFTWVGTHSLVNVAMRNSIDCRDFCERRGQYETWNYALNHFMKNVCDCDSDQLPGSGNGVIYGFSETTGERDNHGYDIMVYTPLTEELKDKVLADLEPHVLSVTEAEYQSGWDIDDYLNGRIVSPKEEFGLTKEEVADMNALHAAFVEFFKKHPRISLVGGDAVIETKHGRNMVVAENVAGYDIKFNIVK